MGAVRPDPLLTDRGRGRRGARRGNGALLPPRRFVDPFGAATVVDYEHDLLVTATRDPRLNETAVGNDYRVLQPAAVVDPNGNRSEVAFDALGLVVATSVMGKDGQDTGDRIDPATTDLDDATRSAFFADPVPAAPALLATATTRLVHDLFAFMRSSAVGAPPEPPAVATFARETHVADLAPGQAPRIQLSIAYSDGFEREIQRKARAEAGPAGETRWAGTGWTIVNNKGKPVRTYEPFFSGTHRCELDLTVGVSTVTFYDPLDRIVATIRPDGTWEKQVIGTWRQSAWDVNDTVLDDPSLDLDIGGVVGAYLAAHGPWNGWRDQRSAAAPRSAEAEVVAKTDAHARTPGTTFLDPLGRAFLVIEHDRVVGGDTFYATRTVLDVEGNQREIVDARGRLVMRHDVDMLATVVRQSSMEAGERRELHDVAGQVVIGWGSRGFRRRIAYDELRRPVRVLVRGGGLAGEIIEQETEYGDDRPTDARNLRTHVRRQRDGAGVLTNLGFDAQGNLRGARRKFAAEYAVAPDWSGFVPLTGESFVAQSEFDALNRPTLLRAPDGTRIRPAYNDAGLLESMNATLPDGWVVAVVTNIDYDAKGRRTQCDHGNGTATAYTYDPHTFRMTALQTKRGPDRLQELAYTYDPVGNITRITDAAQQTLFFRNRIIDPSCDYTYDAVYRLVEATGREHLGQVGAAPVPSSWNDVPRTGHPHPGDGNAMGRYTQRYAYDEVGNLLQMAHVGTDPVHPGWTVPYTYQESSQLDPSRVSNRLTSAGASVLTYDEHGNTTSLLPELLRMTWNHLDQLSSTARQRVNSGVPETTFYIYDAAGERVRKVTERANPAGSGGSRMSERICLGGFEVHRTFAGDGTTLQLERLTTHVMDGTARVALIERRTAGAGGSPPTLVRFHLGNHLGSIRLELDEQAQIISYEEYYPYGSTSYQAVRSQTEAPKRYRYTGKERDEETGLSYHGARYYAPWLARWTTPDPPMENLKTSLYAALRNNPLVFVDSDGKQEHPIIFAESRLDFEMQYEDYRYLRGELSADELRDRRTARFGGMLAGLAALGAVLLGSEMLAAAAIGGAARAVAGRGVTTLVSTSLTGAAEGVTVRAATLVITHPTAAGIILGFLGVEMPGPVGSARGRIVRPAAEALKRTPVPRELARAGTELSAFSMPPASPRLSLDRIRITRHGVDAVERHLSRFVDPGGSLGSAESGMLTRLRKISAGKMSSSPQDLRFYSHELRESVLYRQAGYRTGQPSGTDESYTLWDRLHTAALHDYGFPRAIPPDFLYHPSILGGPLP